MGQETLIRIRSADLGWHPEARSLNLSFRDDVPILKLSAEIDWAPEEPLAALAAVEARLVELLPSLRDHQCRGQAEYHILRSTNGGAPRFKAGSIDVEAALALAHLFEHVAIDAVSFISDAPVVSGATAALKGSRAHFDIFVESPDALTARLAVALAQSWMSSLVAGRSLNGDGRMMLELTRYLYRTRPDVLDEATAARDLGRRRRDVRRALDWLERNGLAERLDYPMNLSGLSYYGLSVIEEMGIA